MHQRLTRLVAGALWLVASAAAAADVCPIAPQPKIYRDGGQYVGFQPTAIVLGAKATEPERYAAECLAGLIERRFAQQTAICTEGEEPDTGGQIIFLGCRANHGAMDRLCTERRIALSATSPGADGYIIEFVDQGVRKVILVGASTPRGAIYGAHALFDLTQREPPEGNRPQSNLIRVASVRDWPSLAWRGRPHSVLAHHLVPGALDAYARARINFIDVRDDPSVKATIVMPARKASMGFPPGVPLDTANVKAVIDGGHRRGMFVYGTVSCSFPAERLPDILKTFNDLIALGVDGLWISFDDTGAGPAAPTIIRAVLDLGKQHGMTGRKIAITPPAGDYEVIDRQFNRQMAKIPGCADIQWMFTRVPCQADADMAKQIGLKRLPGWWHNLVNFGGGFLHNGEIICTLRADGKPAYVDLQPISKGWHKPDYERIRTASLWTDTVLLWGVVNGWPEEYEVAAFGLWAWSPENHDWATLRDSMYRYLYGAAQVEFIREFDDKLETLKALYNMPAWRFGPDKGWPPRLKRPTDRQQAVMLIGELETLAAKVRGPAMRETSILPLRLQTIYLEPITATLQCARRVTWQDYPEYWFPALEQDLAQRVRAGDETSALRLLENARLRIRAQVDRVRRELAALKGIDAYGAFWQKKLAGLAEQKLKLEAQKKAKEAAAKEATAKAAKARAAAKAKATKSAAKN
jgi:hypothetical protein